MALCRGEISPRLQTQRHQQRCILHRREGAQRARLQVHEVARLHALGAVAALELHLALDALHGGFAARHVLGHGLAREQHDAHHFKLTRLEINAPSPFVPLEGGRAADLGRRFGCVAWAEKVKAT